ncbi:UNVERIFIED_CONTAM: hypothetical protein HDU68_010131 [Siphonaria sp. JEL0065]|nr:hypothetical protein HDU68_010131 [Siphonaria sp. JEL0065]
MLSATTTPPASLPYTPFSFLMGPPMSPQPLTNIPIVFSNYDSNWFDYYNNAPLFSMNSAINTLGFMQQQQPGVIGGGQSNFFGGLLSNCGNAWLSNESCSPFGIMSQQHQQQIGGNSSSGVGGQFQHPFMDLNPAISTDLSMMMPPMPAMPPMNSSFFLLSRLSNSAAQEQPVVSAIHISSIDTMSPPAPTRDPYQICGGDELVYDAFLGNAGGGGYQEHPQVYNPVGGVGSGEFEYMQTDASDNVYSSDLISPLDAYDGGAGLYITHDDADDAFDSEAMDTSQQQQRDDKVVQIFELPSVPASVSCAPKQNASDSAPCEPIQPQPLMPPPPLFPSSGFIHQFGGGDGSRGSVLSLFSPDVHEEFSAVPMYTEIDDTTETEEEFSRTYSYLNSPVVVAGGHTSKAGAEGSGIVSIEEDALLLKEIYENESPVISISRASLRKRKAGLTAMEGGGAARSPLGKTSVVVSSKKKKKRVNYLEMEEYEDVDYDDVEMEDGNDEVNECSKDSSYHLHIASLTKPVFKTSAFFANSSASNPTTNPSVRSHPSAPITPQPCHKHQKSSSNLIATPSQSSPQPSNIQTPATSPFEQISSQQEQMDLMCTFCGRGPYSSYYSLRAHLKIHSNNTSNSPNPRVQSSSSISSGGGCRGGGGKFACKSCPKTFSRVQDLTRHLSAANCHRGKGIASVAGFASNVLVGVDSLVQGVGTLDTIGGHSRSSHVVETSLAGNNTCGSGSGSGSVDRVGGQPPIRECRCRWCGALFSRSDALRRHEKNKICRKK